VVAVASVSQSLDFPWRRRLTLGVLMSCAGVLLWRAADLQLTHGEFLQREGRARYLRTVTVPAHRGKIVDRNGIALAVSTPVESVWVNPRELDRDGPSWRHLVRVLGLDRVRTEQMVEARSHREFVYLKRHLPPAQAAKVRAAAVPGVYLQREYRRYYPSAELLGHLLGFTDVDDRGQEGVELAFDDSLRGVDGRERVLRDRRGQIVESVSSLGATRAGRDLRLAVDRRVQYFAYRALAAAVRRHGARGGSVVVLDPRTGEVLAVANQPSFNPNRRADRVGERFRNRALTDLYEPGSTIKPFTVAAALESGRFEPDSTVDTRPGSLRVAGHTVRDARDYGVIDLETVVAKSSNVGAARLALAVAPESLWQMLSRVGFGAGAGSGFPGEIVGVLPHFFEWGSIHQATLSFGYGLSASPLQLARAYAAIANDGLLPEITLLARDGDAPAERVMSARTARHLRRMLETVTGPGGTGGRAAVHGYRVGGKTGTVRKPEPGGYADDRYLALFAGMAPMSAPRLVIVVVVDEPSGEAYYGGEVAAPVFAAVAADSLRVLGIAPDAATGVPARLARVQGAVAEAAR
jgi:cell division protein FtsI (penicillin-binding protein 3)